MLAKTCSTTRCGRHQACPHRVSRAFAYAFLTNSDLSFMAPMPSILQSMS